MLIYAEQNGSNVETDSNAKNNGAAIFIGRITNYLCERIKRLYSAVSTQPCDLFRIAIDDTDGNSNQLRMKLQMLQRHHWRDGVKWKWRRINDGKVEVL